MCFQAWDRCEGPDGLPQVTIVEASLCNYRITGALTVRHVGGFPALGPAQIGCHRRGVVFNLSCQVQLATVAFRQVSSRGKEDIACEEGNFVVILTGFF